jgi:MscS family membrane protein
MHRSIRNFALALLLGLLGAAAAGSATAQEAPKLRDLMGAAGAAAGGTESSSEEPADGDSAAESAAKAARPGETPRATVREFMDAVGDRDYERAARMLDHSRVDVPGATLARELEVVLDKTLWIELATLSNDPAGDPDDGLPASRDRVGRVPLGEQEVPILLQRVPTEEGPEWRFAASTVARIPQLYETHGYGMLGQYLPSFFFELRLLETQLWQWVGLMLLVLLAGIVSWAAASLGAMMLRASLRRLSESVSERVVAMVTGPARLAIGVAFFSGAKMLLGLALPVLAVLGTVESVLFIAAVTWAVLRLVDIFTSVVEERLRHRSQQSAVTLLSPGRRTVKAFIVAIAFIAMLDSFGFDVTAVLAGLGVGGIAVALAAQKTVENLFGGVTLYADRPVRVGDFCRFGDKIGTVEDIGLRSTRVRTLDRTVVSIPNAEFANLQLENFARRDRIWYHPRIGLRYETTPEQMRYVLVEVRRMLYAHPKVNPDPARIRFTNFGAYSLDLDVFAYVDVTDYGEYLEVVEDLNLRIMDIVAEAGSSFAFPSQTTYIEQGEPLDEKQQGEVAERVEGWRQENALYLPRFPEEEIESLRGSPLDFPPRGSPHASGNGGGR